MVCPRCITAVENLFSKLEIPVISVELGEVITANGITPEKLSSLKVELQDLGFELLESEKTALVAKIKGAIIEQLHYNSNHLKVNYSDYLADKLNQEYSYLSRLFSTTEGITIERFIAKQKIERIKKQLFYNEKTLSEIAFEMNYSSVAYLSSQFKKETGITPTEFKKRENPNLKSLDTI